MQNDITTTLREIKQSFRLLMNGVTAQSMREKGLDYHINWGANLLHLREMAAEYEPDKALAMALWQENIRECKLLSTMLMPKKGFTKELAMEWIGQTKTQEIAEIACLNLYQYLPEAEELALEQVASTDLMQQLHGFNILSRLFIRNATTIGNSQDDTATNTFLECATAAIRSQSLPLRHAALNALTHYAALSPANDASVEAIMSSLDNETEEQKH